MASTQIGVIADTHGLLRPQAIDALRGSSLIIHAGDLGSPEILSGLRHIAPVIAVRGNVDRGAWAQSLPVTAVVEAGDTLLYVLHDRSTLDLDPAAAGLGAVIFGHSHQPLQEERDGVLYLNPGSAGPRRFRLPVCLAYLYISGSTITAELIDLDP
jgi:putative phosphoesterase